MTRASLLSACLSAAFIAGLSSSVQSVKVDCDDATGKSCPVEGGSVLQIGSAALRSRGGKALGSEDLTEEHATDAVGFEAEEDGITDLSEASDFPPPALMDGADDKTPLPPPASLPLPAALLHGLVFIKRYKVGGSTWGGVMRRVGYRRGLAHARDDDWLKSEDLAQPELPAVFAEHSARTSVSDDLARRMPKAFFVTLIRDPIARCLSAFYYFQVSLGGEKPTEAAKINYMKHNCSSRGQVAGIEAVPRSAPSAVMNSFDFVALTERFDESLLLLAKKLGIGQVDVMYVRSKTSGEEDKQGREVVPHPPFSSEPQSVQEAARRLLGEGPDAEMHAAASSALDKEIADSGPSFGKDLAEFQRRLSIVGDRCEPRQSCLWRDNGCGQACIESLAEDLHWD